MEAMGKTWTRVAPSKDEAKTLKAPNLSGLILLNPSLYSISCINLVYTLYISLSQTNQNFEEKSANSGHILWLVTLTT
jgi:hypothetical protein